jgi:hypothetical protein
MLKAIRTAKGEGQISHQLPIVLLVGSLRFYFDEDLADSELVKRLKAADRYVAEAADFQSLALLESRAGRLVGTSSGRMARGRPDREESIANRRPSLPRQCVLPARS